MNFLHPQPRQNNPYDRVLYVCIASQDQPKDGSGEEQSKSKGDSEKKSEDEDGDWDDEEIHSDSSHDSWYGDGKGDTKKGRG